jgi:hypothetical protein
MFMCDYRCRREPGVRAASHRIAYIHGWLYALFDTACKEFVQQRSCAVRDSIVGRRAVASPLNSFH